MDKSVFKSRTFWFNLVMALLAMFPKVRDLVSPEIFASLWGFVAIGLRLITKDSVKLLP